MQLVYSRIIASRIQKKDKIQKHFSYVTYSRVPRNMPKTVPRWLVGVFAFTVDFHSTVTFFFKTLQRQSNQWSQRGHLPPVSPLLKPVEVRRFFSGVFRSRRVTRARDENARSVSPEKLPIGP
ncbi:hypothetical protein CEXT_16671 [Caerostris extrusa]|uniref:Uncharacterized protein n=1 Tax=Caerostris extrusa TaxID=172846 RepID=A0AAV4Q5S1_CAEEX|nr:hypothetical protein CEXT_16671 [Caerostris extrusa]